MDASPEFDIAERPSRIPWPPLLLIAVVAVAIALARTWPLSWPGLDDLPARVVGISLGLLGAGLLAWAIITLRGHGTTIMPDAGASALVTSGPYARVRNPIYLADIFILFGAAEITKNIWFVVGALLFGVLVTWLAILPEERHLEKRFGQAYRDYKATTRRWL